MDTVVLAQDGAAIGAFFAVFGLIYLGFIAFFIACAWKLFVKAGEEGWKVLIPFYNYVVWLQIVGRPWWFVLLLFVPFGGLVVSVLVGIDTAKSFGKDQGFAVGLILLAPVFYAILAFGDARYLGPSGGEPRPGWPTVGQGGYGAYPVAQQGYYQAPPGQQWGQGAAGQGWGQGAADQGWGQQPPAQPQQWGQGAADQGWGQQPAQQQWGQEPAQPQWGQQPAQPQWGQPPAQPQWGQGPPDQGWGQAPPAQPEQQDAANQGWGEWGQREEPSDRPS